MDFQKNIFLIEKSSIFPYVLPLKKFRPNFFSIFFWPLQSAQQKIGPDFFLIFYLKNFHFFGKIFFQQKAIFSYVLPLKFFFRPTKKIIFLPSKCRFSLYFALEIFGQIFFFSIFADWLPKKCTSSALHPTKTWLYTNAWDMSFSLIQEAAGFSLTIKFSAFKKIVSVTPQNPKFTPKTNLEVGCEVRDRLLEVFIKIAVFCRTWFLKILVNF